MWPPAATISPAFTASPCGAVNSTRMSGVRALTSSTVLPAAITTSPFGLVMTPLGPFSTFGATRYTWPPSTVLILPRLVSLPSLPVPSKRLRPERKSASDMRSVEAAKPATSIIAPWPKTMPFGLTRNTRPLDRSLPRICVGSCPTTRFSTALAAFC